MLSMEFIPTSPTDEDYVASSAQNINQLKSGQNSTVNSTASTSQKVVTYSTNPEGIKFVPQPPVQFYYSLQKNSLRTVIDTLLSTTELGHICTVFKVPCYGKWLKKKMAADMLVDHLLTLKQAYQRERFNEIVDKINLMKGKDILGRIPRLPERIDALKVLCKSLTFANRVTRPAFPVRLNSPLKEITGMIFLDQVEEQFKNSFTLDFYFTIPSEHVTNSRFILCIYQTIDNALTTVSPTLLDLTLNGSSLELGNCRFRNHDNYDITLFCYKDRANLLRILRHETHVDLKNLIVEIISINIAGSLSESRGFSIADSSSVKRPRDHVTEDEQIIQIQERYLREDAVLKKIDFDQSLALLRSMNNFNKDELEILEDTLKLSLKCPISFTRIRQPVKFRSCRHGQCFDYSNWKQLSQNILNLRIQAMKNVASTKKCTAKISCPICGTVVERENYTSNSARKSKTEIDSGSELVLDGLFEKALKMAEGDDVAIELDLKDGNFVFDKETEEETENDDEEEDPISKESGVEVISLTDSDEDFASIRFPIDKSKPLGSCPSRAISLE